MMMMMMFMMVNRLPRIMKHYSPTGRRNRGRPLKRLLDTWDRNGSTSVLTPWQTYDDNDDDKWILKHFGPCVSIHNTGDKRAKGRGAAHTEICDTFTDLPAIKGSEWYRCLLSLWFNMNKQNFRLKVWSFGEYSTPSEGRPIVLTRLLFFFY